MEHVTAEEIFAGMTSSDYMLALRCFRRAMDADSFPSNEVPEMIGYAEPVNSGFCLTDPEDPRHKYISGLRRRFGEFLHRASTSLLNQGDENTVHAVRSLASLFPINAARY